MRRVLMMSPHFPPDTAAGAHRVRLLAPHLPRYGWEPTVLTLDPRSYEGRLDPGLGDLVPATLRVVRASAIDASRTRPFGIGDLGIRALPALYRRAKALLESERFDALFITIYPTYPALLGPRLKKKFDVSFVLDYQDPWVGAWGSSVGGGPNGAPDFKSRMSRAVASRLEPFAARAADAITAVSEETYEEVRRRNPDLAGTLCAGIPLGGESSDFDTVRRSPRPNPHFDPADDDVHLSYVGTLLPLGLETLRALLKATASLRERQPGLYARLRLHFFGTSNQTKGTPPSVVLPVAESLGVSDRVSEVALRIDYLDALTVLRQSSAILLLGSSQAHYTASKLYPALLSRRPLLAVFHEASSVVTILRSAARPPVARLVTYDDAHRAESRVDSILEALSATVANPAYEPAAVDWSVLMPFSAESLAGKLAAVFDKVS